MNKQKFIQFIEQLCKRPAMYIGRDNNLEAVVAYISGYGSGIADSGGTYFLDQEFSSWLCKRSNLPGNWHWLLCLKELFDNDEEAIKGIPEIIKDYLGLGGKWQTK